jgi:hypothetical protein
MKRKRGKTKRRGQRTKEQARSLVSQSPERNVNQDDGGLQTQPPRAPEAIQQPTHRRWQGFHAKRDLDVFNGLLALIAILSVLLLYQQSRELARTNALAQNQQRAWVGPIELGLNQPLAVGTVPLIRIELKNTFLTPPSEAVLFPGMTEPIFAQISGPLTEDLYARLKAGQLTLYAWGKVMYQDAFGVNHTTEFCGFLARDLKTMTFCDKYNTAN